MLLRPCVICTTTGAVIAMAFSLWFLIAAFTEYRAPISSTPASAPTCQR